MALLSVRGLTKRFDGLVANNEIDLDVPEGSLFAVIGPNGAGKTTFFNMLSGFLGPTAGTIALDGKHITRIAHRIAVLDFGCKIAEGTPDEIKKHPDVIAAYLGTEAANA